MDGGTILVFTPPVVASYLALNVRFGPVSPVITNSVGWVEDDLSSGFFLPVH